MTEDEIDEAVKQAKVHVKFPAYIQHLMKTLDLEEGDLGEFGDNDPYEEVLDFNLFLDASHQEIAAVATPQHKQVTFDPVVQVSQPDAPKGILKVPISAAPKAATLSSATKALAATPSPVPNKASTVVVSAGAEAGYSDMSILYHLKNPFILCMYE